MCRIQKILLGTFLAGVLISGIGTGTAIAEYSSFTYLGERVLGQDKMTTTSLDYTFFPEKGAIRIFPSQYSYYGGDVLELLEIPSCSGRERSGLRLPAVQTWRSRFFYFTEFEEEMPAIQGAPGFKLEKLYQLSCLDGSQRSDD